MQKLEIKKFHENNSMNSLYENSSLKIDVKDQENIEEVKKV